MIGDRVARMGKPLGLAALAVLTMTSSASAHSNPPKLLHPNVKDLRGLAIIASDMVEARGAKYIGAVGICRAEDRDVVKSGPGWRHVRCRMHTKNGYKFLVTWHATNTGKIATTLDRTL
jgi:hypothetical protein